MSTIFLFGAGASRPAGIPTATEMTERMQSLTTPGEMSRALGFIIGGVQMHLSRENTSYHAGVDIERVLNAANLLAERAQLEFAPFVGNWHPMIEDLERASFTRSHAHSMLRPSTFHTSTFHRTPEQLQRSMMEYVNTTVRDSLANLGTYLTAKRDGELFQRLSNFLTGKLIELTFVSPTRSDVASYFDELLLLAREKRVTIATLNYDTCLEARAKVLDIPLHTGLAEIETGTGEFPKIQSGIELLKLHGSIDWAWNARPFWEEAGRPRRTVMSITEAEINKLRDGSKQEWVIQSIGEQLAVLFGGRNKLTTEGPFFELLHTFKRRLFNSKHLIAVGYSFRDPHIDKIIVRWLSSDLDNRITIVERSGFESKEHSFLSLHGTWIGARVTFNNRGVESALSEVLKSAEG